MDAWCEKRELSRQPVISLEQQWQLAVAWYANRLTVESRRPGGEEVREIFSRLGLDDPFWNLEGDRS